MVADYIDPVQGVRGHTLNASFADPEPRQPVDTGSDQPLEELMSEQIRDDASEAESVMAAALRLIMAIPAENRTAHWMDLVTVACPRCDRQVLYAAAIASIEAETAEQLTAAWRSEPLHERGMQKLAADLDVRLVG